MTWDRGEGAYRFGARWTSPGVRAVYCSLDPATAILEVAVHKGFGALDSVPHVLTALTITDSSNVYVVDPASVPNANWLRPCNPSAKQRRWGDRLLAQYAFVVIPSAVSTHSWNVIFVAAAAAGAYVMRLQESFALDTRLDPPTP